DLRMRSLVTSEVRAVSATASRHVSGPLDGPPRTHGCDTADVSIAGECGHDAEAGESTKTAPPNSGERGKGNMHTKPFNEDSQNDETSSPTRLMFLEVILRGLGGVRRGDTLPPFGLVHHAVLVPPGVIGTARRQKPQGQPE